MRLTTRTRRIVAVLAVVATLALAWVGYLNARARTEYTDCRMAAMDALHITLGEQLGADPDHPDVWGPEWVASFNTWTDQLDACGTPPDTFTVH